MDISPYLAPNEEVVFVTRRSAFVLAEDIGIFLLGIGATILIPNTFIGAIALILSFRFLWKGMDWFNDRLIITTQRIVGVSGLLSRNVASMPLTMMTDLTYQRSFLGRILGYGTIRAESAGQDQGLSRLTYVSRPDEFYQTLATLLHAPKTVDVTAEKQVVLTQEEYADEALALVKRGRPSASWDPDDTNPNMIVLP